MSKICSARQEITNAIRACTLKCKNRYCPIKIFHDHYPTVILHKPDLEWCEECEAIKRFEHDFPVKPIHVVLQEISESVPSVEWKKIPKDLAENLDHYLYGSKKVSAWGRKFEAAKKRAKKSPFGKRGQTTENF